MKYERQFIHTFRDAVGTTAIPAPYKSLLWGMANFANSDGADVYPSQATLARYVGSSVATVRRHLKHLEAAGWVELVKRGHSGSEDRRTRSANRYQLRVGQKFSVSDGKVHLSEPATAVVSDTTSEPAESPQAAPAATPQPAPSEAVKVTPRVPELTLSPLPAVVEADAEADADGWTSSYS